MRLAVRSVLIFGLGAAVCAVASYAGDAPARPAAPPADPVSATAKPADVAKFLAGWAEAVDADVDATTGHPKRIRRTKDAAVMALIPTGTFQMGAVPGDDAVLEDEKPRHSVKLSKSYYLDVTETTNAQFEKFVVATGYKTTAEREGKGDVFDENELLAMETAGASWRSAHPGAPRPADWAKHPVTLVSWNDAKAFADWAGAALPTEAQFERAIRGGTEGRTYPWGDSLPAPRGTGNYRGKEFRRTFPRSHFWIMEGYDDGFPRTAPVASFPANAFGVHDLSGNVWEWCLDFYGENYYAKSPSRDPSGPATGSAHVLRGGGWGGYGVGPIGLAASYRDNEDPTGRDDSFGFRCARSLP